MTGTTDQDDPTGGGGVPAIAIRRVTTVGDTEVRGLAEVLLDVVDGGASVGFMHPLTEATAEEFWRQVGEAVAAGRRGLLVAEDAAGIVGTVQLVYAQPENQPHRADVSKMLVHRRARRQGIGAALMRAVEELAQEAGRTLLVLDTASADAERIYARAGWQRVGAIPAYALLPDGAPCATVLFYRLLAPLDGMAGRPSGGWVRARAAE
jgi:GNAT superfamily N-acetyltransferase